MQICWKYCVHSIIPIYSLAIYSVSKWIQTTKKNQVENDIYAVPKIDQNNRQ